MLTNKYHGKDDEKEWEQRKSGENRIECDDEEEKRKERQESTLSHMECLFGFCAEPRGTWKEAEKRERCWWRLVKVSEKWKKKR